LQYGKPSLRSAFANSLRQVDPSRDTGALVGGSIGAVIGQAVIPVPVLGSIVGGVVGGMIGTSIGNFIGHHGVSGKADQGAVSWLHRMADRIDGNHATATAAPATAQPAPGSTKKDAGPVERFDTQYVMSQPTQPLTTTAARATGEEVTPSDALTDDLVMAH